MFRSSLLALLIASPALAQNATAFLPDFMQALNSSGLVRLASLVQNISQTPIGQQLLADLPNGNKTFFAPVDNAFNGKPPSNITDQNLLAAIFSYHVVAGSFNASVFANAPDHTLVRTFLNSSQLVNLEGGRSQVLSLSNVNGTVQILGQNTPVRIVNSTTFRNIPVHIINAVIDPPAPLTDILGSRNLTLLTAAATQAGLLPSLESGKGVTIFAPNDAAFSAALKSLGGASNSTSNTSLIATVLQNHIVNGTSVYAGDFSSVNWTSAAGEPFHFTTNSTGTFVTSGNSTAKVVESDVLTSNGVVHVIDNVLLNPQSDPSAASSAFQSATSVASSTPTPTNPIGPTGSSSTGGGNGTSQNGTNGNSGNGNGNSAAEIVLPLQALFSSFFLSLLGFALL